MAKMFKKRPHRRVRAVERSWDYYRYRPLPPHRREAAERECRKLGIDPNGGEFDKGLN